jgi:hypothetical protein
MLRLTAIFYWIILVTWFAALVAAAATAMAAFGTLPALIGDLGITVPQFAASDPSGPEAGRYVAGFVAQKVFDLVATLQWILVPALLATLLLQRATGWPEKGAANTLRVLLLLVAAGATMYHLVILAPRMANALSDYRGAMRAGDTSSAATHKESFDRDHHIADPILRTTSFLLLGAVILSAASLTPRTLPSRS